MALAIKITVCNWVHLYEEWRCERSHIVDSFESNIQTSTAPPLINVVNIPLRDVIAFGRIKCVKRESNGLTGFFLLTSRVLFYFQIEWKICGIYFLMLTNTKKNRISSSKQSIIIIISLSLLKIRKFNPMYACHIW